MSAVAKQAQVAAPVARYFSAPDLNAGLETELLRGETVTILEERPDFSKVQTSLYRTPGYVETESLTDRVTNTTHRVLKPLVNVYAGPDFKSRIVCKLAMNSLLAIRESAPSANGPMLRFEGVGWIFARDVVRDSAIEERDYDHVELMLKYVNFMYDWGGRVFPDCSGLRQQCLLPFIRNYPRNCGEQVSRGMIVDTDPRALMRGDAVFFMEGGSRHVVTMVSHTDCVHASIANGIVLVEPLTAAIKAQKRYGSGEISAVRRFPWYAHNRLKRLVA